MEENNTVDETLNLEEETEETTEDESTEESVDESTEESTEEDVEVIKSKLSKAEELANNYKIRAEKAEKLAKTAKSEIKSDLSTADIFALNKAGVEYEDINEIAEYAKLRKVSVQEALNSSVIKTILAEKAENRKVAEASNTGKTAKRQTSVSDETLLANASKGIIPENDADMQRLIDARLKNFAK
jgi:hypothetical protein